MARDQIGNSALAGQIWQGGSKRIAAPELRAECLVEAADVAVNDLSNAAGSKPFLDAAAAALGPGKKGLVASRLKRVWGDYHALVGDGKAARTAYAEAESLVESRRSHIERIAWQGARGRSTEQFLKAGQYERAIAEIRPWQDEYPTDKINGYVTLLYARYWAGRERYAQAIALAGQLSAVNADSPYVDQLLVLAADCHVELGAVDRAVATLQSLLKDHPGSPCVPEVKQKLTELQGKGGQGKRPRGGGIRD
jgi:TolA-binding protein